ncbi:Pyrimidine reductase, riboflavin biosynthesis [Oceanobacillus limi]|uniref:Pyrimidine reductase, riboflavin biosynthesis n=1 Tax=Oceanobacillus limi TaxID=930131 RepID=A0A1H9YG68_9BACI|nr:RibD family protein [Oceanobacillus limi]SES67453.1 Pyrimidine reductase, riboflavin biosynthesis [Oceanobacillus limi]
MKRPTVILNVFSSIDGKITTAPAHNVTEWAAAGLDGGAHDITHRLYDELECDGLISGSETLMVYGKHWVELDEPIYEPKKSKAYIVFDGRGRINWYQTEGLIVITREDVPEQYIAQLKDKGIRYIQAGKGDHIHLELALRQLYDLGFTKLGLSGGGAINGAFLRHGLIDEISLVIAPLAVGGTTTPSLFDCPELESVQDVMQLELLETKPVGDGSVWLHYKQR